MNTIKHAQSQGKFYPETEQLVQEKKKYLFV